MFNRKKTEKELQKYEILGNALGKRMNIKTIYLSNDRFNSFYIKDKNKDVSRVTDLIIKPTNKPLENYSRYYLDMKSDNLLAINIEDGVEQIEKIRPIL